MHFKTKFHKTTSTSYKKESLTIFIDFVSAAPLVIVKYLPEESALISLYHVLTILINTGADEYFFPSIEGNKKNCVSIYVMNPGSTSLSSVKELPSSL